MLIGDRKEGTKLVLEAFSSGGSSWVLDSGCKNHMTREKSMFSSYAQIESPSENIVFGDNSKGEVLGVGKISITQDHSISNVLHVDLLSYNLLSISQLCEMGYDCHFMDKGVTTIRREDSSIAFMGHLKGKLYLVDFNKSKAMLELV
jgi:thiamine kinase-like enzyme